MIKLHLSYVMNPSGTTATVCTVSSGQSLHYLWLAVYLNETSVKHISVIAHVNYLLREVLLWSLLNFDIHENSDKECSKFSGWRGKT